MSQVLLGLFLLSHPGPVVMMCAAVAAFALLGSFASHFDWRAIAFLLGAHFSMQLSISFINDYRDRELDATMNPRKPITRGLIKPNEALWSGLAMTAIMAAFVTQLRWKAIVITLVYFALMQSYNLGLKSTGLSGFVLGAGAPLLPLYSFTAVGYEPSFTFWLYPLAFFLGIAANLANSLPDLESDAAFGARTLTVILGLKRSFLVCAAMLASSAALMTLLSTTGTVPAHPWVVSPTILAGFAAAGSTIFFADAASSRAKRMAYFYLVAFTCALLLIGWTTAVLLALALRLT